MFQSGTDIDKRLGWPLGRAESLARRGKLPHVVLPDGLIRFEWTDIEALLLHVKTPAAEVPQAVGETKKARDELLKPVGPASVEAVLSERAGQTEPEVQAK